MSSPSCTDESTYTPTEQSPLLSRPTHDRNDLDDHTKNSDKSKETPIPWAQFSLVLFLQLAEPLTSQVIYPFIPQLIREIGITDGDETRVGFYVGLMQSLFFATQALTVFHWSRISDRVGRKPVILVGLFGLTLSMYCFGLSRTFAGLVISRCLSGALNGNIGVIKSMMGELTDASNVARAFAYQPIPWSFGASIGPMIGGALAHPAERFPTLFGGNKFLERYPYFLPCAIPATFSVLAWTVVFFFLKETNPTGFSVRNTLHRLFTKSSPSIDTESQKGATDTQNVPSPSPSPAPPIRALLTPQVLLATSTYALLSLLDIAYRALQPVFYSTPRSLGGLGLPPPAIGTILALLGFGNGVFQVTCFARMCKRWGVRKVYMAGIACAAPIFVSFPLMTAVVHAEDAAAGRTGDTLLGTGTDTGGDYVPLSPIIIALLSMQIFCTMMINTCYGCVFIYITAAASTVKTSAPIPKPSRPPISSSSSSTTLVLSRDDDDDTPTPSPSRTPSLSSTKGPTPTHTFKSPNSNSNANSNSNVKKVVVVPGKKKGKQTLGAVNGLAQCTVSVMRCLGPYAASWLFTRGLALRYGSTPLPESPVFEDSTDVDVLNSLSGLLSSSNSEISLQIGSISKTLIRQLEGYLVYAVLLVLVGITLVVGERLPAVPWKDEDEEEKDKDGEVERDIHVCNSREDEDEER